MKKLLFALGGAAVLLFGLVAPASAHVVTSISEAPAGGFAAFTLRIGHGCDGAGGDTVKVEVQMPDGIEEATPQAIPGWEATVDDAGPVVVTWDGGPLAHDQYLEFGVSVQMPDTPGETALFPTVQTCESGEEIAWVEETPEGGEEPEHPAPAIAIVESEGDGHGAAEDEHADEEVTAPEGEQVAATELVDEDGTDPLAIVALIVGALGLAAGGYAVMSVRKAS